MTVGLFLFVRRDPLAILLILLCAAAAAWIAIHLAGARPLSFDEIEFARPTRWIAEGKVPFRDFWEHHTPLQWYLFAPVARALPAHGAGAIVVLRAAQIPLWLAALFAMHAWMRTAALERNSRLAATALLLASAMFAMPALEYRIDTVATCTLAAALALRFGERPRPFAAGVLLTLTVLANMRFAGVAAVAAILALFVDVDEQRWRIPRLRSAAKLIGGLAAPAIVYGTYLLATGSAAAFWRNVVLDNAAIDRLARRWAARTFWNAAAAPFLQFDVAAIAFVLAAVAGGAVAILRLRRPDRLAVMAAVAATALAFVFAMPVHYPYHFVSVFFLAAPLVAFAVQRATVAAAVVAAVAVLANFGFTAKATRDRYGLQDHVMREVARFTRPGDRVLDGVGFALHRDPAYRYWFLPLGVRYLAKAALIPPYDPRPDPPAAVVLDRRVAAWMQEWPAVGRYVTRHYVPFRRNLWLPGLSGIVEQPVTWTVPADGTYRAIADARLLGHPWFQAPILCGMIEGPDAELLEIDPRQIPPPQHLRLTRENGQPIDATRPFALRKGEGITAGTAGEKLGVLIVRADLPRLFDAPRGGISFDEPLFQLR